MEAINWIATTIALVGSGVITWGDVLTTILAMIIIRLGKHLKFFQYKK